jgi:hypothetical protein
VSLSQNRRILAHLAAGNTLTPLQALLKFECLRLAARVYELRRAGHHIVASTIRKGGKAVACYRVGL